MGLLEDVLVQLDEGVTGLFGQWNIYTTAIVTAVTGLITYQVLTRKDPDIHPMLLARQSHVAQIRNERESPVYRSQMAPHSMPLNSGLGVRDPGASKWTRGRDGDLRDIWRQAINGVQEDGANKGATGRILMVLGSESVVEHKLDDVTRQINLIGQHILEQGGNRVAIYLPNSVELIVTLFACAFYNLTACILPFDDQEDRADAVISMLRRSAADTVVTAPGAFPFDTVVKSYPALRQLVWVVDEGSKHMDWNEVAKGTGGSVNVSTWQEIVDESPADAGRELPPLKDQKEPRDITVFWQLGPGKMEDMTRFTAANLVSAVAAQISAIPTAQRMGPADLFLPADCLANTHTLALTLAALYCNASVAFNSVASQARDLKLATGGIAPTIVVATPATLLGTHEDVRKELESPIARARHWLQTRSLAEAGVMPVAAAGPTPGKLRLVFAAERVGANTPALSSAVLSDLRVATGARVIYALTAPKVAGAVAQTGFYDYRVFDDARSHFGPPLTSTEVLLRDAEGHRNTDTEQKGEIIVRGPCVAMDEAPLGVLGYMRDDGTLAYINP